MSEKRLTVAPPTYLERPPERSKAALLALRALFREHLDTRGLDSSPAASVDQRSSDEEEAA
jgi:hypothetical protein